VNHRPTKTVEVRIMKFLPIPLVFEGYVSYRKSNGFPLIGGVEYGRGGDKAIL